MTKLPGPADRVNDRLETVGHKIDTTFNVVSSVKNFLAKCKNVGDRLDFVVRAVDGIAEVFSFSSKRKY